MSDHLQSTKGQATKNNILREGLVLASVDGLVNVSIGNLAAKVGMSRSGLFAHFLSKEQLQVEILQYSFSLFDKTIIEPCRNLSSPLQRLLLLKKTLPDWYERTEPVIPGGCIFQMACLEFDDRPGKVRNILLHQMNQFIDFLKTTHDEAVAAGEFTGASDTASFAFVYHSFYLGCLQHRKFFGDEKALEHFDQSITGLIDFCINTPKS